MHLAAEQAQPEIGAHHEEGREHDERQGHRERHLARGQPLVVLDGLVGRDGERPGPDRERLSQREDPPEAGLGQQGEAARDRPDLVRFDVDRLVRAANGHRPVAPAAHHHSLDDGLAAVEVILSGHFSLSSSD